MAGKLLDTGVLDVPIYSIPMAARLVGLKASRVRRWLRGYVFTYSDRRGVERSGESPPVVSGHEYEGRSYASFLHLMDLLFVREFLQRGFSLQAIRDVLDEVQQITGAFHFAKENLRTDGHRAFLGLQGKMTRGEWSYIELRSGRQEMIPKFVEMIGGQIDFSRTTGWAEKWHPPRYKRAIVLDPQVCFGRPTIVGHRITTTTVREAYLAEGGDVSAVSDWMGIAPREVRAAVSFEKAFAAAA